MIIIFIILLFEFVIVIALLKRLTFRKWFQTTRYEFRIIFDETFEIKCNKNPIIFRCIVTFRFVSRHLCLSWLVRWNISLWILRVRVAKIKPSVSWTEKPWIICCLIMCSVQEAVIYQLVIHFCLLFDELVELLRLIPTYNDVKHIVKYQVTGLHCNCH